MKKVFFLVNNLNENSFSPYIGKYLKKFDVSFDDSLPKNLEKYDLVVLWNYRKIIQGISNKKNIIIFHGSDLPGGKGWAPIYYSIFNGLKYYTVSGILPADEVDSGDIVIKAKFQIKDNFTAEFIRECDNEVSVLLVRKILDKFKGKKITGKKQVGKGSYNKRRKPEDNEVDINSKVSEIINHIRGCEKQHPAFFYYKDQKYNISIFPDNKPKFPEDLEIIFSDND